MMNEWENDNPETPAGQAMVDGLQCIHEYSPEASAFMVVMDDDGVHMAAWRGKNVMLAEICIATFKMVRTIFTTTLREAIEGGDEEEPDRTIH